MAKMPVFLRPEFLMTVVESSARIRASVERLSKIVFDLRIFRTHILFPPCGWMCWTTSVFVCVKFIFRNPTSEPKQKNAQLMNNSYEILNRRFNSVAMRPQMCYYYCGRWLCVLLAFTPFQKNNNYMDEPKPKPRHWNRNEKSSAHKQNVSVSARRNSLSEIGSEQKLWPNCG